MVFDTFGSIEIDGKSYKVSYPNATGWEMETHLTNQSMYDTVAAMGAGHMRSRDIYYIIMYGLLGGNKDMSPEKADNLTRTAITRGTEAVVAVQECLQILGKCGCIALPETKKEPAAEA